MTSLRSIRRAGTLAAVTALVAMSAGPAAAAGTLTVGKSSGLAVGDKVTVSAKGLSPNQGFAPIGLCKPKPAGPTDCETSPDSSVIGKTDASGVWHSAANGADSVQITVKATAGGANCAAKAGNCVIAVSISATKELVEVPLTLSAGGSGPSSPAPSSPAPTAAGGTTTGGGTSTASGGGTAGSLPQTGSTDGLPVAALLGGTLFLFGGCALVLLRRGRRV
ncbi:neocarzinostatin apoprotein domain-containing protein [Streptomyces sp. NBC_00335]|uniref:neocarzinostatin apoprotein domain-containing protein n=1 Tax=unclassified Streptomyces TaxID=2593676 RepID=UPI0022517E0B|nr:MULTISPECIES: neocarzinostatin apoprotein domain-containing protein [unclassified Streptomyces]MCX5410208.1 neocarzinostatin apoprotein domain-containing protein [Streptomyces sp. NBC_00086]